MSNIEGSLGELTAEVRNLNRRIEAHEKKQLRILEQLNRWKGMGAAVIFVGGAVATLIGWLMGGSNSSP